jgi:hypothetical protein
MGLNHDAIFAKIEQLTAADLPVGGCMKEAIQLCSFDVPHASWPELSAIDYDGDLASLGPWIPGVFEKQPAPFQIKALWIGLCNPSSAGGVWADMYVAAMGEYESGDDSFGWLWKNPSHLRHLRHYPKNAYAHSSSLRRIYEIAYRSGGLANDAEWPLCLAFGAFAARALLRSTDVKLIGSIADRIGVVVGFDGGDMLKVGELNARGDWR